MNAHRHQLQLNLGTAFTMLRDSRKRRDYLASMPQTAAVADALYECRISCRIMRDRVRMLRAQINRLTC